MNKNIFFFLFQLFPFFILAQDQSMTTKVNSYLQSHLTELELQQSDINDYKIYREYVSKKSMVTHVFLQQQINGIPIHHAEIRLHWSEDMGWLLTQNTFVKELSQKKISSSIGMNHTLAIKSACSALNIKYTKPNRLAKNVRHISLYKADFSRDPIPIMSSIFIQDNQLKRVYDLTIYESDGSNCWNVLIDQQTGELLRKYNWVKHCSFNSEISCTHINHDTQTTRDEFSFIKSSGALYNVFAIPIESPSHGERTIEVDPYNILASPYGWHDTNGQNGAEFSITRGNNVHAYADLNDVGFSQGDEPNGGNDLIFDFPFDPLTEPDQNLDAATVNLFYMSNMMHDVWYHYGFDPQAGNFQSNNYGEGGLSGDYVFAEAQDSSGVATNIALNNANFYTPNDGNNPVMQMYIWNKPENPFDLFTVNQPEILTGNYEVSPTTDWAGIITSEPINGLIELVDDGSSWPTEGCGDLINDLTGKIALISRGTCEFGLKTLNAENAGAIAVIIYNNVGGIISMAAGADGSVVTIPSVFMGKLDGELLRDYLQDDGIIDATFVNNSPPGPDFLDGDFDNGIIAHEYGHGISTRLTGSNCLYGDEQAGEGWSDFFALMMTNKIDDFAEEPHGIGTYVSAEQNDGRGIRSYPYSRDMNINPLTYDDIITESVPHGVGSVWTTILWDLFWNFVDVYGYDEDIYNGVGGNNMVMQLVIDGLKLQPCQSNFTNLRDGILVADELLYDAQNKCLIWETFARRGLGISANGGSADSRGDGTESFDNLPECIKTLKIQKSTMLNANAGDDLAYTLSVQNHTEGTILSVVILDTLQSGVAFIPESSSCNASIDQDILTFNLGSMSSGQTINCNYSVSVDENLFSTVLFEDDMEDGDNYWITLSDEGFVWELDAPESYSGEEAWFAADLEERYQALLELEPFFVEGENPTLSFWHKYLTEPGMDGGYISISTDEVNFEDLGPQIIRGHYRGVSQGPPPLGGKNSFWGDSDGFINTLVDLNPYMGETVTLRFTFVTDEGNNEVDQVEGWTIDDVRIIDRYEIENTACVYGEIPVHYACDKIQDGGTIIYDDYGLSSASELRESWVQVFPNPANESISIRTSSDWTKQTTITIYNIQGKLIEQFYITDMQTNLSSEIYSDGLYFIKISDGFQQIMKKFTVIH